MAELARLATIACGAEVPGSIRESLRRRPLVGLQPSHQIQVGVELVRQADTVVGSVPPARLQPAREPKKRTIDRGRIGALSCHPHASEC